MKKRNIFKKRMNLIILLTICLLFTGCSNIDSRQSNSNQSIEETVSDNIDDNNLVDTYFNFDNFNFENCGQNTFSTATTLNKNEIGILKYENKSNYTVKIAITSMTNKSIDKFITVNPKSISVIKYG